MNLQWTEGAPQEQLGLEAGMVLEIRKYDGSLTRWLVGDINDANGICSCCRGVDDQFVVVRWARIPEELMREWGLTT